MSPQGGTGIPACEVCGSCPAGVCFATTDTDRNVCGMGENPEVAQAFLPVKSVDLVRTGVCFATTDTDRNVCGTKNMDIELQI